MYFPINIKEVHWIVIKIDFELKQIEIIDSLFTQFKSEYSPIITLFSHIFELLSLSFKI